MGMIADNSRVLHYCVAACPGVAVLGDVFRNIAARHIVTQGRAETAEVLHMLRQSQTATPVCDY